MLAGKKLVITGVVTRDSIAFEVARQAQEAGAEIVPPADTRRRLTEALRTLEAVAHPAHGVKNIPL